MELLYIMSERKTKMKKIFIPMISLLAIGSLTGCNNKVDYSDLQIISPSGAPALALYDMLDDSNVEINTDPSAVAQYIAKDSIKDIVISPTNLLVGASMKEGAPFKIAATITFGNFYIAATGNDDNDTFDKDDYIVIFQKLGLPGKLFNYTYGDDYNLINVANAQLAAACLKDGINVSDNNNTVDYVLVAEPSMTPALAAAKALRPDVADKIKMIKNVQEDYKEKSGNHQLTQASIYVKDTDDEVKKEKINAFLEDVKNKITKMKLDQGDLLAKVANLTKEQLQIKLGAPSIEILKNAVNRNTINIGYQEAKEGKASIDNFLKNLGFSSEDTNENLYW